MKKYLLIIYFLFFSNFILLFSQSLFALRIAPEAGVILNSNENSKFGIGGIITFVLYTKYQNDTPNQAVTIGLKGFNNPWENGKFITSIKNNEADAFNYIAVLLGYKLNYNYIYFEPRVGFGNSSGYSAVVVSPQVGYMHSNFDFAVFLEAGYGKRINPLGGKKFANLGLSIGYTFDF